MCETLLPICARMQNELRSFLFSRTCVFVCVLLLQLLPTALPSPCSVTAYLCFCVCLGFGERFRHADRGGYAVGGSGGGGLGSRSLGTGAYTMSLADVLDPMARCIESESSLDEMNRLCRTVTQYIVEGHRLDSDTKKNMRPLIEKCLTNRWYQQFQTLSHLVYGEDAI